MPSTKRSILYVDDDRSARLMLMLLLGQKGYEVMTISNSQGALFISSEESYDLYILGLPGKDCAALCRKIREFDRRTPIIIYFGAIRESDREAALTAGVNVFVAKPHIENLLDAIVAELDC